jgi:hypothetical protein
MRIMVGTLYTIENEFNACCASIRAQTHTDYEHVVFRDLSKREAHHALYGTFMQRAEEFDLLVKVDADMVLIDPDFFLHVVKRFSAAPELDLLLIAVHDFFTDGLVTGINIFRNSVRWHLGDEELFTDRTHVAESVRRTEKDLDVLAPAAHHCPDPGPFQSFHYGFHRGIKAVHGGKRWKVLERLCAHYRRRPDGRLALALLGANTALLPVFAPRHISYTDGTVAEFYATRYADRTEAELHAAVRRSRIYWILRSESGTALARRYFRFRRGHR